MASFCEVPFGTVILLLVPATSVLVFVAGVSGFVVSVEDTVDDKSSLLNAAKSTIESRANNPSDMMQDGTDDRSSSVAVLSSQV